MGESDYLGARGVSASGVSAHGAVLLWSSNNPEVAEVSDDGEIRAISPGDAEVSIRSGVASTNVAVHVEAGARIPLTDVEWDIVHAQDCGDAVGNAARPRGFRSDAPLTKAFATTPLDGRSAAGNLQPATRVGARMPVQPSVIPGGNLFAAIDGSSADSVAPDAAKANNAVGSPRFAAVDNSLGSATGARLNLRSANYTFATPVQSLRGRDVDVDLALVYNSRLWTKTTSGSTSVMSFNFDRGWPAAGWRLGYGRMIANYDNTGTGTLSGVGSANAPGNAILVSPDGTRTEMFQSYDSVSGTWVHDSHDGTFLHFESLKLYYPDGMRVSFGLRNNRYVPVNIRTPNGNSIDITYKLYFLPGNPFRWAISFITDTLGRVMNFNYDSTGRLTSIDTPGFNGGADRTLVKFDYTDITLSYSFSSSITSVDGPASGSSLTVLRRVYYPGTGTGYIFTDFSGYGQARKISVRRDMTGSGGSVTDGTETGSTQFTFAETGALSDAPTITERKEYWQGKTDDAGTATSSPTTYTYSYTTGSGTMTATEAFPTSTQNPDTLYRVWTVDTSTSSSSIGAVLSVAAYKNSTSSTPIRRETRTYVVPTDGGLQLASVVTDNDASQHQKTAFAYGTLGRLSNVYEYGFQSSGVYTLQRETQYQYLNTTAYLDLGLRRLVTQVKTLNGSGTTVGRMDLTYDDYTPGMTSYSGTIPGHGGGFSTSYTTRGNVTKVTYYSNVSAPTTIDRFRKFDILGNLVQADLDCCDSRVYTFSATSQYSAPDTVTDGTTTTLSSGYSYDFNTSAMTQRTDADALATSFSYDSAMRLYQVTKPTLSGVSATVVTTTPAKDANGNDQMSFKRQVSFADGSGSSQTIAQQLWTDGVGHVLRSGTGSGTSPTSFDAVQSVYDSFGRLIKRSNPYIGGSSGTGTPGYWTTVAYDVLSRAVTTTLPDGETHETDYSGGASVVATDEVGRQREYTTDGLGRLASVVEQNPSTGVLDATNYQTSYGYDTLNDLTSVTQGSQSRSASFDALRRVVSSTNPETGTETVQYTDFGAVKKRTDARGVETHFQYDGLHRVTKIWFTGTGGSDDPSVTPRPSLPSGVSSTPDVTYAYNTSAPGKGNLSSITDYLDGSTPRGDTFSYDSIGRVSSHTRYIDARHYDVGYTYNGLDQVTTVTYPSGRIVRTNYDARARVTSVDNASSPLASYLSSASYDTAGNVTGYSLGNSLSETFSYSSDRLQLISHSVVAPGSIGLMALSYGYSASSGDMGYGTSAGNTGQLVSQTGAVDTQTENQSFTYDSLGRLATAAQSGVWQRRFAYDRWNNRTGVWDATSGGTQIQSVSISTSGGAPTNRISSVTQGSTTTSFTYDAAGNVTNNGQALASDAAGRLASFGASAGQYTYDSSNRRTKRVTSAGTVHYVWDGDHVIAEYNGSTGTLSAEYIFAGSHMIARDVAGSIRYFHRDFASTRLITDGSGTVKGVENNLPFGEDAGTTGAETEKHRFTSYDRDPESNADYAVNRYLTTDTGRFLQPDPVRGRSANPQSLNRYAYALNDPVNHGDPLGLDVPTVPCPDDPTALCTPGESSVNDDPLVVTSTYESLLPGAETGGAGPAQSYYFPERPFSGGGSETGILGPADPISAGPKGTTSVFQPVSVSQLLAPPSAFLLSGVTATPPTQPSATPTPTTTAPAPPPPPPPAYNSFSLTVGGPLVSGGLVLTQDAYGRFYLGYTYGGGLTSGSLPFGVAVTNGYIQGQTGLPTRDVVAAYIEGDSISTNFGAGLGFTDIITRGQGGVVMGGTEVTVQTPNFGQFYSHSAPVFFEEP